MDFEHPEKGHSFLFRGGSAACPQKGPRGQYPRHKIISEEDTKTDRKTNKKNVIERETRGTKQTEQHTTHSTQKGKWQKSGLAKYGVSPIAKALYKKTVQ